jgi:hypothetical protein
VSYTRLISASLLLFAWARPLAGQVVEQIVSRVPRLEVMVGQSNALQLAYYDRRSQEIAPDKVKAVYRSNDTSLAVVSNDGVVLGRRAGNTKVRVQVGQKVGWVPVAISELPPAPVLPTVSGLIQVIRSELLLVPGESGEVLAKFRRSDGVPSADVLLHFVSATPAIATVDSLTGVVHAMTPGQARIIITAPGAAPTGATVSVGEPAMALSTDSLFLIEGMPDTLRLLVTSQRGRVYKGPVAWETSNANVARVDSMGVVTGVTRGSAKLTATSSYFSGDVVVQVFQPAIARSTLQPDSGIILPLGTTTDLVIRGVTSEPPNTPLYVIPSTWTVENPSVADYDRVNGQIIAKGPGTTTLTGVPRISGMNRPRVWKITVFSGTLIPEWERIGLRVGMKQTVAGVLLDTAGVRINRPVPLRWDDPGAPGIQISPTGAISIAAQGHYTLTGRAPWGAALSVSVFGLYDLLFTEADNKGSVFQGMTLNTGQRAPAAILRSQFQNVQPAVSPDRTRMVYSTNRTAKDFDLWIADPDGGNERQLLRAAGSDQQPVWFPSGNRIVFTAFRPGRQPQLYSVKPDGTDLQRITDSLGNAGTPAISPDGGRIAYETMRKNQYDIFALRAQGDTIAAGTREQPLVASPDNERSPQFLPTGDLAFIREEVGGKRNRSIMRLIAGSQVAQAITTPEYFVRDFAVSPDGLTLVFSAPPPGERTNTRNRLYIVDLRQAGVAAPTVLYAPLSGNIGTPVFVP